MPTQPDLFSLWHDNLTATGIIPGVKSTDPAALATNNGIRHSRQTSAGIADAAAKAAQADLNRAIAASRAHASGRIKDLKNDPGYNPVLGDRTDLTQAMPVLTVNAVNGGVTPMH